MRTSQTTLSPSLRRGFESLRAQREAFFPTIEGFEVEMLWRRPTDTGWAIGDTVQHLCKTMRVYWFLIRVSWPVLYPMAWLFRNRSFERSTRDIFAEYQAAGKRMKATGLLVPHRPDRLPPLNELREELNAETNRMEGMLAGIPEGVAGHFRIFDPGVGSPNLIQRVQLLAFHERHHFKIMEDLIAQGATEFWKKDVRRKGLETSKA